MCRYDGADRSRRFERKCQRLPYGQFELGPIDGQWTPELTAALKEFQKALGVKPTGVVDAATLGALEKKLAGQPSASPSPSPSS